jgi:ABC-2 type transport system permease protein
MVAAVTARKAMRSGLLWGVIFALYVAAQAATYARAYRTDAARHALAHSLSSSSGLAILVGPARDLASVGGYTAWKCLVALAIMGAVWGLLTATRLLRGEEDAGRWELLAAGHTTRRRAATQALAGLAAAAAVFYLLTAAGTAAVGLSPSIHFGVAASFYFSFACVAGAVMFLAVGALASQLAATRRQAAAYAAAALGVAYAIRMVADSTVSLSWMLWLSPFGWVERLRPFAGPDPWAVLPIVAFTVAAGWATISLAGRRDLGASTLADHSRSAEHDALLGGPVALGVRLVRPTVLGWMAGIAAMGLLLGSEAKVAAKSLGDSTAAKAALERLGGGAQGLTRAYLGVSFLILAVMVALVAATLNSAVRREESLGHVEHLLVRPYGRHRWFWGRLAVSAALVAALGVLSGLATWGGAAAGHAGVGFTSLMAAGANVIAPALCLLGVGALVMGGWPRAANVVVYAGLAWSFLVELLGSVAVSNHWLLDTSVFHQIAPAPAVAPNWVSAAALVAVGAAGAVAGSWRFAHRDLVGD